jgi:hypothetical protein
LCYNNIVYKPRNVPVQVKDEHRFLIKTTVFIEHGNIKKLLSMFCTIRGEHSHFCIGRAQSIQCAMTQHTAAVGCHHMRLVLTDPHLMNPPVEPDVGYPLGCVTKKVVLLPTEATIQGGFLFFKLALCYFPRSCSK